MTKLIIQLMDSEYHSLEKAAKHAGKSVHVLIHEWIARLPEAEESFDVTQDPIFLMEGCDSDAPADLSRNLDEYLYREKQSG